jgi:DNA-binding MarR family transcriptional regulator
VSEADHIQRDNHDEITELSVRILALLGQVTERFDSDENESSWQWFAQHSSNQRMVDLMRESTATTLRVLDAIGRLEPANGITISEQFHIPKGTVSKITRRLIAKDLITQEALPKNKKEILFRLTPLGKELFEVHRAFDEQMERGFLSFLQRYNADELRLLTRVLHDATEASFLTLGLQAPLQPEKKGDD